MKKLVRLSREDNRKSIEVLKKNGIEVVNIPKETQDKLKQVGSAVQKTLTGELYSEEFLKEVLAALEEFRKSN